MRRQKAMDEACLSSRGAELVLCLCVRRRANVFAWDGVQIVESHWISSFVFWLITIYLHESPQPGSVHQLVISEDGVLLAVFHDVVRRDLVVYKQRCSRCSKCNCTLARMRQVSLRSRGLVDSWRCSITVSCGCYLCFVLRCFQLLVTECTFLTADVDILEIGRCYGS